MIDWFRLWSKDIVIAVIIATLIEMLLPDNTSKKYIKIIIGIFVVYTIISPIIGQFVDTDIQSSLNENGVIETSSKAIESSIVSEKTNSSIRKIYAQNLENDLRAKLNEKGFVAGDVCIQISNDESYNIEHVNVCIDEKVQVDETSKQTYTIVDAIKYINIKVSNKDVEDTEVIDEADKNNIKEFIKNTYDIDIEKIDVF